MNKTKRIFWIDGLRGFACLMIFIHHFMVGFFPATYYGTNVVTHMEYGRDAGMAQSPLSVLINGNFWVCVFCLLSGLVQSYKIFNKDDLSKVPEDMLKRYFRLAFPVFCVSGVVYIMMQMGIFFNTKISDVVGSPWMASYYLEKASLRSVFVSSFKSVWVSGDYTFSNAFWMLIYIFVGSYLTYILAILLKGRKSRSLLILALCFMLFYNSQSYLIPFVFGILIAYMMTYYNHVQKWQYILGLICLGAGLFLGGYPTGIEPTNIYSYFKFIGIEKCHIIGALFLVFGIYNLNILVKFFENKILLWFGKISFGVYLIHIPIIFSVSAYMFMRVYSMTERYQFSVSIAFIVSVIVIIILAYLFNKYVENICNKISKKIVSWVMEK